MKVIVFYIVLRVLITLRLSQGKVLSDDLRPEYCDAQTKADDQKRCVLHKCNRDNTEIFSVACSKVKCRGDVIGYKGDKSKPYPQCCIKPICRSLNPPPLIRLSEEVVLKHGRK